MRLTPHARRRYDLGVMKLLAADTSTSCLSIAICSEDSVYLESTIECDRRHTERFLATIDWGLKEAGLTLTELDALAITTGPGSFTGLRVGLAAMKGLAVGAALPLVGVPTLDALAHSAEVVEGAVCTLLDAKMGEVFAAAFEVRSGAFSKVLQDRVCSAQDFVQEAPSRAVYLGDGAHLYRSEIERLRPESRILGPLFRTPRAAAVALEAVRLIKTGAATSNPDEVSPVYLRMSQAERARNKAAVP